MTLLRFFLALSGNPTGLSSPPRRDASGSMTSCKEAIKDIEVEGAVATEMEDVRLCPISNMKPLITKMDNALSTLKKCKHLRMSSNAIGKIEGLAGCDSLTILSLGRNALKKIEGLNEVADTLEQLWISYNQIGSFAGIEKLTNLQVLYASNNKIDKWPEIERLQALPKLREVNMVNNPLWVKHVSASRLTRRSWRVAACSTIALLPTARSAARTLSFTLLTLSLTISPVQNAEENWRIEVIKRLEKLKSLDGSLIEDEEREQAKAES